MNNTNKQTITTIKITWRHHESCQSFSGYMIGYITNTGLVGSFSEDLLPYYEKNFKLEYE
jgi:hypothetical protein